MTFSDLTPEEWDCLERHLLTCFKSVPFNFHFYKTNHSCTAGVTMRVVRQALRLPFASLPKYVNDGRLSYQAVVRFRLEVGK